jgi:hypothetical protein
VSPLNCLEFDLRDSANQPIPATCVAGSISYEGAIATDAVSWSGVKVRFE